MITLWHLAGIKRGSELGSHYADRRPVSQTVDIIFSSLTSDETLHVVAIAIYHPNLLPTCQNNSKSAVHNLTLSSLALLEENTLEILAIIGRATDKHIFTVNMEILLGIYAFVI